MTPPIHIEGTTPATPRKPRGRRRSLILSPVTHLVHQKVWQERRGPLFLGMMSTTLPHAYGWCEECGVNFDWDGHPIGNREPGQPELVDAIVQLLAAREDVLLSSTTSKAQS